MDVGSDSAPALADLDADGDLDLASGEFSGVLFSFENTGTAESPVFVARTGTANPLGELDVSFSSTPTFADLEADGDLDLVLGQDGGGFSVRYLPEPALPLGLAASLPLLHLLDRLRRRRERRRTERGPRGNGARR